MEMRHQIEQQLKQLRMPGMWQALEVRLAEARDSGLGHLEFPSLLIQDELINREDNMLFVGQAILCAIARTIDFQQHASRLRDLLADSIDRPEKSQAVDTVDQMGTRQGSPYLVPLEMSDQMPFGHVEGGRSHFVEKLLWPAFTQVVATSFQDRLRDLLADIFCDANQFDLVRLAISGQRCLCDSLTNPAKIVGDLLSDGHSISISVSTSPEEARKRATRLSEEKFCPRSVRLALGARER